MPTRAPPIHPSPASNEPPVPDRPAAAAELAGAPQIEHRVALQLTEEACGAALQRQAKEVAVHAPETVEHPRHADVREPREEPEAAHREYANPPCVGRFTFVFLGEQRQPRPHGHPLDTGGSTA